MKLTRPLTRRQLETAALLAKGLGSTEAGDVLGITFAAATLHVRAIASKIPNPLGLTPLKLARQWAIANAGEIEARLADIKVRITR